MKLKNKPLPVPIPLDLANDLKVDPSYLSHINAGRKTVSDPKAREILELSLTDTRMTGLHYLHLRPSMEKSAKWISAPFEQPRGRRRGKQ
jgi:hypothetical protein